MPEVHPAEARGSVGGPNSVLSLGGLGGGFAAQSKGPAHQTLRPGEVLRSFVLVFAGLILFSLWASHSPPEAVVRLAEGVGIAFPALLAWFLCAWALSRTAWDADPDFGATAVRTLLCAAAGTAAVVAIWWWRSGLTGGTSVFEMISAGATGVLLCAWHLRILSGRERQQIPLQQASRLLELQSRIRPHFLFNTLNTALALTRVSPQQAEAVLEDLSDLFRAVLDDRSTSSLGSTLEAEIDLARKYLQIEKLRFGDRLRVRWQLAPGLGNTEVPSLLLQPLIENAVRHGVEPSPGGADIDITTERRLGVVRVSVFNTCSGEPSRPGHGIALGNVKERLELAHGWASHLHVARGDGWHRVDIEIHL
jgi:two-component system, LytTR family, sensor histidine kinase AlgZ